MNRRFALIFLSAVFAFSIAAATMALTVDLNGYPAILNIFAAARKSGQSISVFGGTSRDILLGSEIGEGDQFDILLPGEFSEGELTLEQRAFLEAIAKAAGGMKKCHFIYAKGRETFTKLYSVGGLSLNKIVISMDGKVMDRHGGLTDLQKKTLRHVPGVNSYWPSFLPLFDVLRGIRFMTQYPELNLDPGTMRYYVDSVRQVESDRALKGKILAIFKNVAQGLPHAQGFPGDSKEFVTTKVQIRGIKDRLDKIFMFAQDRDKAERLLEEFGVATFLKGIRWPEKDYVVSKMDPARFKNFGKYAGADKVAKAAAAGLFASNSMSDAGSSKPAAKPSGGKAAIPAVAAAPAGGGRRESQPRPASSGAEVSRGMKYEDDGMDGGGYSETQYDDESKGDLDSHAADSDATDDYGSGSSESGAAADSWAGSGDDFGSAPAGEGDPASFEDPFEDINFEDFNLDDF